MLANAFHELGVPQRDVNGPHQVSGGIVQTTTQDGARVSLNNAYVQPIRYKRKNLTVKVKSEAYEILIDDRKVAYGVKYSSGGKRYTAYAKKEVILSAGSISSPQLLMLSGVGPRDHLSKLHIPVKKDLAVGENLHDHVTFNGLIIALSNKTSTIVSPKEMLDVVVEYKEMKLKHGRLSYNGPVNTMAFIRSDSSVPAPDVQISLDGAFVKEFVTEPATSSEIKIFPTAFYNGIIPRVMNIAPKSRGKLLLNASDPYGPPEIYSGYFNDPTDLIPIVRGVRFYLNAENTEAFKSQRAHFVRTPLPACRQYEWGTDDYTICLARQYTSSPYHPVGTCKMGPKWDHKAVVDPRLRVYGISHLRVIDASIMPQVCRGNTNAPSIMIGEKGAELIYEEWGKKY